MASTTTAMAATTAERPAALARSTIVRVPATTTAILSTDAAAPVATTLLAWAVGTPAAVLSATRTVPISLPLSAAYDAAGRDADQRHRTAAADVSERATQFSCASTVFLFHRLVAGHRVGDIRSYVNLYDHWSAYRYPDAHYVADDHDALPEVN